MAITWPAKGPNEKFSVAFVAPAGLLAEDETIVSAALEVRVESGADTDPGNILDGALVVDGLRLVQKVKDGLPNVVYGFYASIVTSEGRELDACPAWLPVLDPSKWTNCTGGVCG